MNQVKAIREMAGMKQKDLAMAAKVSGPYLVDVEKGRRGAKPETWQRIADALGVTVEELKGDDNGKVPAHPAGG